MRFFSDILQLAAKDVRIELRSKEAIFSTLLFVVLILVIFNFSFGTNLELVEKIAPGIIWIVIAFSGTIAVSHLAHREFDGRVHEELLLSGLSGTTLFFAKFISTLLFMMLVELLTIPLFVAFYNFPVGDWIFSLLMILGLGTIGYAAVGTLFAALLSQTRLKDLLLPIIFYPIMIPLFIACVKATQSAMAGETPQQTMFLVGFDLIFVLASALLFDFVVEDAT
jgi:heme exporter protein B